MRGKSLSQKNSASGFSFQATIEKIASTPVGREAAMYGPIRDLFIHILGYPAPDVDIDTIGEEGRPDVTVRAPSGFLSPTGQPMTTAWVVVEAKDEPSCFLDPERRENIFALKSKYVGPHTAWFVMVEPKCFVLRPVTGLVHTSTADIVIETEGLSETDFREKSGPLSYKLAGVSAQLERFRNGDPAMIAVDRLTPISSDPTRKELNQVRLHRKKFFQQIREATQHLQSSVLSTLQRLQPEISTYLEEAEKFWAAFGRPQNVEGFDRHTLTLRGAPSGPTQVRQHDKESARLRRLFAKSPEIARLAVAGLSEFQNRTGVDEKNLQELFAIETANLILARVLLLRFFEDHGFFGTTRYVCNGGVQAFQNMHKYFKSSYSRLLEQAYEEGSHLYASAFDETELDWIFGAKDGVLSSAIEWTLFRFARYNFATIRGDILTGIYDRFMDRKQRKKLGEFYTPPSIAKYIVQRLGVNAKSTVLDPACGSGTFLIESYQAMVGHNVERGAADYDDVLEAFTRIAGVDLNTFSSVLAQVQLLWQILDLQPSIEKKGFPDIRVTGKVNSLVERDHFSALDRFSEIDVQEYDAVVGNPPYIRSERSAQALDVRSKQEFERERNGHRGISSSLNSYALFLYRALDRWCKPPDEKGQAGKVGFVLQVSLFDSTKTSDLRSLFAMGGRWTIREIVDLEIIYRKIFDADVIPAIFIAENREPREDDVVSIRIADSSCVKINSGNALPEFDLGSLPENKIAYNDLFSPDGRILTRLKAERIPILTRLQNNATLAETAKQFWVRKIKARVVEWTDQNPNDPRWEAQRMISGGIAFRTSDRITSKKGFAIYKGENIIAAELQGEPALVNADIDRADDSTLWRYRSIHPPVGLAVAGMAHCPNGVLFDPSKQAFTNTATILLPSEELSGFPFDLILMSNVYVWFYAIGARMGIPLHCG